MTKDLTKRLEKDMFIIAAGIIGSNSIGEKEMLLKFDSLQSDVQLNKLYVKAFSKSFGKFNFPVSVENIHILRIATKEDIAYQKNDEAGIIKKDLK